MDEDADDHDHDDNDDHHDHAPNDVQMCVICLDVGPDAQPASSCGIPSHAACASCLRAYVEHAIQRRGRSVVPRCPGGGCHSVLSREDVDEALLGKCSGSLPCVRKRLVPLDPRTGSRLAYVHACDRATDAHITRCIVCHEPVDDGSHANDDGVLPHTCADAHQAKTLASMSDGTQRVKPCPRCFTPTSRDAADYESCVPCTVCRTMWCFDCVSVLKDRDRDREASASSTLSITCACADAATARAIAQARARTRRVILRKRARQAAYCAKVCVGVVVAVPLLPVLIPATCVYMSSSCVQSSSLTSPTGRWAGFTRRRGDGNNNNDNNTTSDNENGVGNADGNNTRHGRHERERLSAAVVVDADALDVYESEHDAGAAEDDVRVTVTDAAAVASASTSTRRSRPRPPPPPPPPPRPSTTPTNAVDVSLHDVAYDDDDDIL